MEPLFFKAENLLSIREHDLPYIASMEPLFFKAENFPARSGRPAERRASMEPLFFKAENGVHARTGDLRNGLQWSRFFSKRKMC